MTSEHTPDDIDAIIGAFADKVRDDEDRDNQDDYDRGQARRLQDETWTRYQRSVLQPREGVWEYTRKSVEADMPTYIQLLDGTDKVDVAWRFERLADVGGLALIIGSSLTVKAVYRDNEAFAATRYLCAPTVGLKTPSELLGVQAEGRGLSRRLPVNELRSAIGKHILDTTPSIHGTVHAQPVGQPKGVGQELANATLFRSWHSPAERPIYLRHDQLDAIVEDIDRWNRDKEFWYIVAGDPDAGWSRGYLPGDPRDVPSSTTQRSGPDYPAEIAAFIRYPAHAQVPDLGRYNFSVYPTTKPVSTIARGSGLKYRTYGLGINEFSEKDQYAEMKHVADEMHNPSAFLVPPTRAQLVKS